MLGESCIWQGSAGGNVEVSKDFYIEGFLKKLRPEVMSVTRVKTRGDKIIRAGGARATYGEGQRGKE